MDQMPTDAARTLSAPLSIAAVALAVRDIGRVTAFYRDVLGLEVIGPQAPGAEGVVTSLGVNGTVLLRLFARPDAPPPAPGQAGLFHIAFLLPGRADLGRWLAHRAGLGVALEGAADHLVSEAAYLSDPEGNGIEVYADRPAESWRWHGAPGARRIEMANRPLDHAGLLAAGSDQSGSDQSGSGRSGSGRAWAGAPAGTRIGHVHLRVGDMPRAVRFYAGTLGLDITTGWPEATFLSTGGYHHHIAVNTWASAGAGPRDPAATGLAAITLAATDPAIPAAIARRAGLPALPPGGLRDPWGTTLHIHVT